MRHLLNLRHVTSGENETFGSNTTWGRSTTHPRFDPTAVRTHNLQMPPLTIRLSVTSPDTIYLFTGPLCQLLGDVLPYFNKNFYHNHFILLVFIHFSL